MGYVNADSVRLFIIYCRYFVVGGGSRLGVVSPTQEREGMKAPITMMVLLLACWRR